MTRQITPGPARTAFRPAPTAVAALAAAASLLLLIAPDPAGAQGGGTDRTAAAGTVNTECGYYCLAVGLRTFGLGKAGALRDRLGDPGEAGYSLSELAAAAEGAGAHALAVRTTLDGLRRRTEAGDRFAAVAHVDGNHYVVVTEIAPDGRVEVLDPPGAYAQPPATFNARWDGAALLVSPDPLTPEADLAPFPTVAVALTLAGVACAAGAVVLWRRRRSAGPAAALLAGAALGTAAGCDAAPVAPAAAAVAAAAAPGPGTGTAAFASPLLDLGEVPVGGAPLVREFPFRNAGDGPLHILALRTSCGCTDATVTQTRVPPGGAATVRVAVTPDAPAKRQATVTVVTDSRAAPRRQLAVRWHAVPPLRWDPPELDFGTVRPGETAERVVELLAFFPAPLGDGRPGRGAAGGAAGEFVVSPGSPLTTAWEPTPARPARPASGPDGRTRRVGAVRVRFAAPRSPGRGAASVSLVPPAGADGAESGGGGGGGPVRLAARWEVRDLVAVTPAAVFLGTGPAGSPVRARVLVAADGPVTITDGPTLTSPEGGTGLPGVTASVARLSDERLAIDLAGALPTAEGRHAADLIFTATVTDDTGETGVRRRTVRRPVSAFVFGPAETAADGPPGPGGTDGA